MKKCLAILFIILLLLASNALYAQIIEDDDNETDWYSKDNNKNEKVENGADNNANNNENNIGEENNNVKLIEGEKKNTELPAYKLSEKTRAAGSFWRETCFTHFAGALGFGFLHQDFGVLGDFSGIMLDLTAMFEYSFLQNSDIPLSAFAQLGLGLHTWDDQSNFGVFGIWFGGKYRLLDGTKYKNLFFSTLVALGIGFGSDAGNAMWSSQKYLVTGDFSLAFGGTGSYLLASNMGIGTSLLFAIVSAANSEFQVMLTIEYFYNLSAEIALQGGFDIRSGNGQNIMFFAQCNMQNGLFTQFAIPLDTDGALVFMIIAGYDLKI